MHKNDWFNEVEDIGCHHLIDMNFDGYEGSNIKQKKINTKIYQQGFKKKKYGNFHTFADPPPPPLKYGK